MSPLDFYAGASFMGVATWHEVRQLHARYAVKPAEIKKGDVVQVIAYRRVAYSAIVIDLEKSRACVEFRKRGRGGFVTRRYPYAEVFIENALQKLRDEVLEDARAVLDELGFISLLAVAKGAHEGPGGHAPPQSDCPACAAIAKAEGR